MKKILNKKTIIVGSLIILLGLASFLVKIFVFSENTDKRLEAIYNENKLIPFYKDEKMGYKNNKGEEKIEPIYLKAKEFFDNFAIVEKEENKYEIIDVEGKTLLTSNQETEPIYYPHFGVLFFNGKLYNEKLEVIFEGNYHINYINYGFFEFMNNEKNESGIVDYRGKVIYQWNYDYIQVKISKNDYTKKGYYALITNYEEDEKIIDLNNGKELFTLDDPKNTYIKEEKDNIFRIIDRSDSFKTKTWLYICEGKIAYKSNESIYSMTLIKHDDDILEIDYGPNYKDLGDKQYIYYNVKTGKNLEAEPLRIDEALMDNLYGYHTSVSNNKYGIKKGNKELVECQYDEIKFLDKNIYNYVKTKKKEHLVLLKKDNMTILYNIRKKKNIVTFNSTNVIENSGSSFLTITLFKEDGFTKKGILIYNLLTHKSKEFETNSEIEIKSNFIVHKTKDKYIYYNTNLEEI